MLKFVESRLTVLLGDPQGFPFSERGDEAVKEVHAACWVETTVLIVWSHIQTV